MQYFLCNLLHKHLHVSTILWILYIKTCTATIIPNQQDFLWKVMGNGGGVFICSKSLKFKLEMIGVHRDANITILEWLLRTAFLSNDWRERNCNPFFFSNYCKPQDRIFVILYMYVYSVTRMFERSTCKKINWCDFLLSVALLSMILTL